MAIFQKSSVMPRVGQRLLHQVVLADRGAAGDDEDVGAGRAVDEGGDRLAAVRRDAEVDRLAAGLAHERGKADRRSTRRSGPARASRRAAPARRRWRGSRRAACGGREASAWPIDAASEIACASSTRSGAESDVAGA